MISLPHEFKFAEGIEKLPKLVEDIVQTSINTGPCGPVRLAQGIQAVIGVGSEWLADASKAANSPSGLAAELQLGLLSPVYLRKLIEHLGATYIKLGQKEAEKHQQLKIHGHGEYREIAEADFLSEVTSTDKVISHFYHREFYRCKIMDKHLKNLAPRHLKKKFIKVDADNSPFFVTKLRIKTLPCVIIFSKGVVTDRLVGFQDLGGKGDFSTRALELFLLKKGAIEETKRKEEDDDYPESRDVRLLDHL